MPTTYPGNMSFSTGQHLQYATAGRGGLPTTTSGPDFQEIPHWEDAVTVVTGKPEEKGRALRSHVKPRDQEGRKDGRITVEDETRDRASQATKAQRQIWWTRRIKEKDPRGVWFGEKATNSLTQKAVIGLKEDRY